MSEKRLLAPEDRVAKASQEAYKLALDAMHDSQLQEALFRRLDREMSGEDYGAKSEEP